jgi:hypothetical protein
MLEYPDATFTELGELLIVAWNDPGSDHKEWYVELEEIDKARLAREVSAIISKVFCVMLFEIYIFGPIV